MKVLYRVMSVTVICVLLTMFLSGFFAVHAEDTVNHETNDNNSIQAADLLTVGIMTVGRLSDKKDVDCFRIDTTIAGDILFCFAHESDGAYAYYWYAEVMDAEQNVLLGGTLSGRDVSEFSVQAAKPGSYYLRITPISGGNPLTNGFTDAAYKITVTNRCLNHGKLGNWEVVRESSCKQEGQRARRCSVCKCVAVTEAIPTVQHVFSDWSVKRKASLLDSGEQVRTCVFCDEAEEQSYISAETMVMLAIVGIAILVIIIIAIVSRVRENTHYKYSSYSSGGSSSGSSSGSSGGGYSYDGSNIGGGYDRGLNTYYTDSRNGQWVYYKDGQYVNENGERVPLQYMDD